MLFMLCHLECHQLSLVARVVVLEVMLVVTVVFEMFKPLLLVVIIAC